MSNIGTFLQGICSLLNKKAILKKCYRTCAILTTGFAIIAVVHLTDRDFGGSGKNSVSAKAGISQNLIQDLEETSDDETTIQLELGESFSGEEASQPSSKERTLIEDNVASQVTTNMENERIPAETKAEEAIVETNVEVNTETVETNIETNQVDMVTQENMDTVIPVSQEEYEILLRIVEAEATNEDVKGKMLVANVVLNRVESTRFPDDIESVVFQKNGKKYQFSPIRDGRYYEVEITETTRLAVDRVLAGEDESMGALFFACREMASAKNMKWFDTDLVKLFKYGCHEFFTYP